VWASAMTITEHPEKKRDKRKEREGEKKPKDRAPTVFPRAGKKGKRGGGHNSLSLGTKREKREIEWFVPRPWRVLNAVWGEKEGDGKVW